MFVAHRRITPITLAVVSFCVMASFAPGQQTGLDVDEFSKDIRIQDDLYRFANGKWLKATDIPSDKSNYGSFTILGDLSQERIKAIVDQVASETYPNGHDRQKVGDFYRSYMDTDRIDELGLKPLAEEFDRINAIKTHEDVVAYFGRAQFVDIMNPIGFYVSQDAKDSTRYLAVLIQSGTSLPDRDYYLEDDEKYEEARAAYKTYITKISELAGVGDAAGRADRILEVETKLAKAKWPRVKMRDANARYNLFARHDWVKKVPDVPWAVFFREAGVPGLREFNVSTPSFFEDFAKTLHETPVRTWQEYLTFHVLDDAAPSLPTAYVEANFAFRGTALAGVPENKPRWKRAINKLGAQGFGVVGDILGKLYVEKHFQPEAKRRMDELVANLLQAYEESIDDLSWMTDETKAKAREKLAKITPKVGYTKKWRDYSKLEIDPKDLIGNLRRSNRVEFDRMIGKLGQPIDREEWGMTPQTVNAYYSPSKNEIVFPAAILQPPFFNLEADDAVNYGAIGAVIGHEISHAFDDQGSKYDGDGNLKNWWTARDRDAFEKITRRLVDQYSEYSPLDGRNVNGELTLGENIADLSGLSIAYKAYQLSLNGEAAPELEGWSGGQRFFLGWSQAWRRKYRDAEMMRRLLTDPHAPSWYRANGPVVNIDAFYEAFEVKPEDALFKPKADRIKIW